MTRVAALLMISLATLLPAAPATAQAPDVQRRRSPVVRVFEQCRDAVVNISTTRIVRVRSLLSGSLFEDIFDFGPPRLRERRVNSVGSGVLIHENGYIVTNAHVVAQTSDVRVTFADKSTVAARIVAVDREHDLAVLRVRATRPLPNIELGRSDDIMVGETVVAIGNPLGLQHTVTAGIVSALDRDLRYSNERSYSGLIQTDAAINPGNSGGPLINVNAELIGINTAIRGDAQNVGFAIPVNRLWDLLPMMLDIERHQRVRFGVRISGQRTDVIAVRPESPAHKSGIRPGDRVVRMNGEPLRDGIDYYVHLLAQKPGSDVRLTLQRGGKTRQAKVPLQIIPPPDGDEMARHLFGMGLVEIPPDLRRRFDLPDSVGLMVEEVEGHGPAGHVGVRPGDLILRLDRLPVTTLEAAGLALEGVEPGRRVVIDGFRLRADPPFPWTVSVRTRRTGR